MPLYAHIVAYVSGFLRRYTYKSIYYKLSNAKVFFYNGIQWLTYTTACLYTDIRWRLSSEVFPAYSSDIKKNMNRELAGPKDICTVHAAHAAAIGSRPWLVVSPLLGLGGLCMTLSQEELHWQQIRGLGPRVIERGCWGKKHKAITISSFLWGPLSVCTTGWTH